MVFDICKESEKYPAGWLTIAVVLLIVLSHWNYPTIKKIPQKMVNFEKGFLYLSVWNKFYNEMGTFS